MRNEWIDERELVVERRLKGYGNSGMFLNACSSSMMEGALELEQMHWVTSISSPVLGEFGGIGGSAISKGSFNYFNYMHK